MRCPAWKPGLHGVFDKTGEFEGFSANYSGWGFRNMRFAVKIRLMAKSDNKMVTACPAEGGPQPRRSFRLEKPDAQGTRSPFRRE